MSLLAEEKKSSKTEKGQTYNVQGKAADKVFCLAQGSAKVTRHSDSPMQESIVRIAAPGDLLGYRCVFSEETFRATGSALEENVSCEISKSFFLLLIENDFKFASEILKRMGQEISAAENHHHSFCKKNVRERLAEALLILCKKASTEVQFGLRIDIQLTRQEMASWVGTAKESVIRCLADFKEENLIQIQEGFIIVLSTEKLSQVARVSS